jgi:Protein of unknown function (DUF4242)
VTTFLGESYPIGCEPKQLVATIEDAREIAAEMRAAGSEVSLLSSTFVPAEEALFCLFEAPSAAVVFTLGERSGLRFAHVVEALDVGLEALASRRRSKEK